MKNWTGVSESGLFEVWVEVEYEDSAFGYVAFRSAFERIAICGTSEEAVAILEECGFKTWGGIAVPQAYSDRMAKLEEIKYWKRVADPFC